jgi:hypothetical protein
MTMQTIQTVKLFFYSNWPDSSFIFTKTSTDQWPTIHMSRTWYWALEDISRAQSRVRRMRIVCALSFRNSNERQTNDESDFFQLT